MKAVGAANHEEKIHPSMCEDVLVRDEGSLFTHIHFLISYMRSFCRRDMTCIAFLDGTADQFIYIAWHCRTRHS